MGLTCRNSFSARNEGKNIVEEYRNSEKNGNESHINPPFLFVHSSYKKYEHKVNETAESNHQRISKRVANRFPVRMTLYYKE